MIRVGKSGVTCSVSAPEFAALRSQFDQQHYLRFPGFLDADVLDLVQRRIDKGDFYERVHEGMASNKELCMVGNAGSGALLLFLNDGKLFQIIREVTQCARIRCFDGRVYRASPGQGHHDSWHNDIGEDRLVGMSINLSRESYAGGLLQIRDHESRRIVSEAENLGAGDAIVFRLSPQLQHRITEVEGSVSKTAFAGWFRAQPDFSTLLRERAGAQGKMTAPTRISRELMD